MYVFILRRGSRYKSNVNVFINSKAKSDAEAVSDAMLLIQDANFDIDFIEVWHDKDSGTLVCTLEL